MNTIPFEDFKQLIETTVGQSEAHLRDEIKSTVRQSETRLRDEMSNGFASVDIKFSDLRREVNDGFAAVGDALGELNDHLDKRDQLIDRRLTKLEQQTS